MLTRTLDAAEGLDVTVLYVTSVAPFDAQGLASVVDDVPLVVAVEPFYEGTLVPALTDALRHVPARFASIGVPRRFITAYGTLEEHDRDLGMDAAGIRGRLASILDGRDDGRSGER